MADHPPTSQKPDDDVGKPGAPAFGGGGQTAQQAAITSQGPAGETDVERRDAWTTAGGTPGRNPVPAGGSSDGQSDRKR